MLSLGLFGIEKVFIEINELLRNPLSEDGVFRRPIDCCTNQDILEMFKIAVDEHLRSISGYSDIGINVSKINITSVSINSGSIHLTLNDKKEFMYVEDATYRINEIIIHKLIMSKTYNVDEFINNVGEELASRILVILESYLETLQIEGSVPYYKLKVFKISKTPKVIVLEIKPLFDFRLLYHYLSVNSSVLVIETELADLLKDLDEATVRNKDYILKALGRIS